jgi:hypothetical protein
MFADILLLIARLRAPLSGKYGLAQAVARVTQIAYSAINRLTHRVFRSAEEIIDGCYGAWNWRLAETGRIRSLSSYPWFAKISI